MTPDEIIRMAREAGLEIGVEFIAGHKTNIERFAALVAAHEREKYKAMDKELAELYEMAVNQAKTIKKYQDAVLAEREACAKVCEEEAASWARLNAQDEEGYGAIQCAAAIRARGEK